MKNYEIIKEQEQRLIFSRLDPLLRMLLASIDKLSSMLLETNKHQDNTNSNSNSNSNSNDNDDINTSESESRSSQEILTLYKLQFGMMKDIETALHQLVPVVNINANANINAGHESTSNKQTKTKGQFTAARQTIHQMQRYILLPLILILQKPLPCVGTGTGTCSIGYGNSNKRNDNEEYQRVSNIMIRNAARHCYEGAASCLRKIAGILHFDNDENDMNIHDTIAIVNANQNANQNENEEQVNVNVNVNVNTCMETNLRIKCVVAISQSLACTIQDISMNQGIPTLDKGEDCIMELLACMKALILRSRSRSRVPVHTTDSCKGEILDSSWKEFWVEFYSCRNGQLLHTIIHCITSILDSRWHSEHNYNDGNGVAGQQGRLACVQMDIKGNVELKLEALSLMRSLMTLGMDAHDAKLKDVMIGIEEEQGRSVVDEWRSIFPGVFKVSSCRIAQQTTNISLQFSASTLNL